MLGVAVGTAALVAAPVFAASTPSRVGFAICPHVTQTTYPGAAVGPGTGCGSPVSSPGSTSFQPDGTCTTPTNTDLGTFLVSDEPLGAYVGGGGLHDCSTNPPTLGPGAGGAKVSVSVAQTGFCPTTREIPAQLGTYGSVLFPIGSLPLGTYRVTAALPDQTAIDPQTQRPVTWSASRATGTLHIGSTFSEAETIVLASADKNETFATLLRNSVSGPGAGRLAVTRTGNPSVAKLTGTGYYGCGTIDITATVTFGKRAANGLTRLTGKGGIVGGTGNYKDLAGTFTLTGSYSAKTKQGALTLKGTATY